uniref:NB-ARC domain-containing protein n=1 Tax=Oryza punctata TaxID=4537 RepID=A0A0E0L762_ORYPU
MKKDLLLKVWAEQVRSLSYDIEDCLEEFMVHVGNQNLFQQLISLKDRHRIAVKIRNLKSRVEEVSCRNTRYNSIKMEVNSTFDEIDSMEDGRNHFPSNIDEAKLVGFDTSKKALLDKINIDANDDEHCRVLCVVGMGGLGKTTLVRKIFESKEDIANNFTHRAWIVVSQSFSKIEMLKDMISQLLGPNSLKECLKGLEGKAMQVPDVGTYLQNRLKELRYFVVFDDMWNTHDWEWIKEFALPSTNNKRSRVIVTTRLDGVANACTTEPYVYRLKLLEIECAIDLLLRKIGKNKEDMKNDENLKSIVTQLVKKCGRLPLAIVTIGAMFANKHSSKWEEMCSQLPSELESNPSLEAIRRVVTLSYDHLPSHLKPCFLYLSIFPEDFEIKRRHLVNRWIAEGLVRARVAMTISDVGESYFDELISRSMIQPSRVDMEGRVKSCRVHDIMRDIIVSISKEENFVYSTGDNVPTVVVEKFRHLSCHGGNNPIVGMDFSRVRSLTVLGEFHQRPMLVGSSICSAQFTMLRVLDLENARFRVAQKDINNVGLLRHLRYLNIHTSSKPDNNIYALPRSIGKLQNLQVLDLRSSEISTLPTDISKLRMLRFLRCSKIKSYSIFDPHSPYKCLQYTFRMPLILTPLVGSEGRNQVIAELHRAYSSHWSYTKGVRVPTGISRLKELQVLEVVDLKLTKSKAIEELGELHRLQKLSVTTEGAQHNKHKILCEAIEKLSSLRSLCVDGRGSFSFIETGTLEWLGRCNFSPPPLLRKLTLYGRILVMPDCFRNHKQLRRIHLYGSELDGRAIRILGTLPNLMLLILQEGSYIWKKLAFKEREFPNLKELGIMRMHELRGIRFEKDASPHMERIDIANCELQSGIVGIKHLEQLKEISLQCREVKAHPNETRVCSCLGTQDTFTWETR